MLAKTKQINFLNDSVMVKLSNVMNTLPDKDKEYIP